MPEATASPLFEAVPIALVVLDEDGRVVRVNTAFERLLGYDRASLIGAPLAPHVDVQSSIDSWATDDTATHEATGTTRTGRSLPLDITLHPVPDHGPNHVLLTLVDVSVRRRAEARFRVAVEASPHGMLMVDPRGVIVLANQAAELLFGYTPDELLGKSVDILVPEALRRRHPELREAFLTQPSKRPMGAGRDLFGRHRDGSEKQVEIGLTPIETADGTYVLASVVDIHARKQTEAALRRSNEELERFAHVASHDLQEPLRTVASYVQLLERRYKAQLGDEGAEFIEFAVDGVHRMRRLIDDLLTFSRVGSQQSEREPTDMRRVVDEACERLRVAIEESGASVTVGALPAVLGDARQLEQLMANLLGNALKFRTAAPPEVRVSATVAGRECTIVVADNGIGIDPQYADRVFVIFQRLHLRDEFPGTGVGLAVCKKIVERHGGRIWVESVLGEGARFCFTLPVAGEGRV